MKNPQDEEFYLLIPNPITEEEEEFDLEMHSNVSLVLRLIRKREKLVDTSRKNFEKIKQLRKEYEVDKIEESTQSTIKSLSSISEDDFDSKEEYEEKLSSLEKHLVELKDAYPQEIIDLQNSTGENMENSDRLGVKICAILLKPVNGVPKEYPSKKDYIEEFIGDDQDIQDVINFFLSALNSITRLHKGKGIEMKSRKNKKTE